MCQFYWKFRFYKKYPDMIADYVLPTMASEMIPIISQGLIREGFDPQKVDAFTTAVNNLIDYLDLLEVIAYLWNADNGVTLATLLGNMDRLMNMHYPEFYLAWLQSQDENYGGSFRPYIPATREVRVNCPVDVSVYDSSGTLKAQIINDIPQEIAGSSIISSFNQNNEKMFYLPADESYDIIIAATDDGVLNYSVSEYSYTRTQKDMQSVKPPCFCKLWKKITENAG